MRRPLWYGLAFGAVLALSAGQPAWAGPIFNNFGAGDSYKTNQGDAIGKVGANNFTTASEFTATSSGNLSSITIALSRIGSAGSGDVTVKLETDSGSGGPGSVIESFSVPVSSLGAFGGNNSPVVLNSVLDPALTAGTDYWLVVSAPSPDSIDWNFNPIGDIGDHATSVNGGAFFLGSGTHGAFRLDSGLAAAVPEPATLALVGLGALGLVGYRRLRRRAR
jgi:hypothetical protein